MNGTVNHAWKWVVACLVLAVGCAGAGRGDVDRSQPDKLDKTFLMNPDGTPNNPFVIRDCQNGVCAPVTGACHGKSAADGVTGNNTICSPCRDGFDSDCGKTGSRAGDKHERGDEPGEEFH